MKAVNFIKKKCYKKVYNILAAFLREKQIKAIKFWEQNILKMAK